MPESVICHKIFGQLHVLVQGAPVIQNVKHLLFIMKECDASRMDAVTEVLTALLQSTNSFGDNNSWFLISCWLGLISFSRKLYANK